jgi:signal transduction histidine kinase
VLIGGVLLQTRRRGPSNWWTASYVVIGSLGAVVMAVGVGHEGYIALFWLGLGPIIGLVISGPRLAGWLLLPAAGLAALAILLIVNEVVRPFIRVDHLAGPHIVSLLGAIFSYFLLVLSFERETARTIAELARTIAELARSIDEGRQARALAERAAQARGEFLAMMGHEVRTPLNGVLGIVSVMLAEHMPPEVEEGLRTIESSGAVLRALLDNVLDYSRYESGQYELESRPLELAQVGRDVIELMRGIALGAATGWSWRWPLGRPPGGRDETASGDEQPHLQRGEVYGRRTGEGAVVGHRGRLPTGGL